MVRTASTMLPLGTTAPGFKLPDIEGRKARIAGGFQVRADSFRIPCLEMTDHAVKTRVVTFVLLIAANLLSAGAAVDRRAVVKRHDVVLNEYDADNPLQVGNGGFAFAVDATGLQTFIGSLGTFSDWGWHTFANPEDFREEETLFEIDSGGGRTARYACKQGLNALPPQQRARAEKAYAWYRRAPHRLHLGRIGFELHRADGGLAVPADLAGVRQVLDLWSGTINSTFEIDGLPVEVTTCCHPKLDLVAVKVKSPLAASGRLRIFWHFPYMAFKDCNAVWDPACDAKHKTEVVRQTEGSAELLRTLDADSYCVTVEWTGAGAFTKAGPHRYIFTGESEEFSVLTAFAPDKPDTLASFDEAAQVAAAHWEKFWTGGGAIDLSESKDPRWKELERRVVLSQYLTAIQSCGSSPPQESGLFWNSWYGKFHLEMTAWHGVHFVLWGRADLLDGWMQWFRGPGLESALRQAAKQGYKGARWMKMVGPEPRWESPSAQNPWRMTQQGHAIFWAELMYREDPDKATLERYRDLVLESAKFMADFLWWDEKTGRYVLGPPIMSGSEATDPLRTYNTTVELSYWFYGLRTAQLWRQRLGVGPDPNWDRILRKLSKPPVAGGLCVDAESHPDYNGGRPAWLEAYGCMRGDEIDTDAMRRSFEVIWGDIKGGSQKWQIFGFDFPMLAMTAARLGKPKEAIDALLSPLAINGYGANGFNTAGSIPYIPASGGYLWAVAMMAAGWEGGPGKHAPGFPDDGSWVVKWEGLKPAP